MSKMDRGFSRCTGFTTRRCLVCHFAAVAADEFKACAQYRQAAYLKTSSNTPPLGALFHAIIRPAFARIPGISRHVMHLRPRLRPRHYRAALVVTRPLPAWQHVRQALPVTPVAWVCIWQPSARTECISLLHNRPHQSQFRPCLSRRRVVSLVCQLQPSQMPVRNCLPDIA